MRLSLSHLGVLLPAAAALLGAGDAAAAGYAYTDQSAAELGTASAGAAAAAEDASTIVDNPAGLTRLPRAEIVGTGTLVLPSLRFTNTGSTLATGAPTGGANDDGGVGALLPSFFGSMPLNPDLAVGLGLFPSFGLATDYQRNWIGRYHAQDTDLTSIDFAPAIAYRVLPTLSIGISPIARYTKVKYSNSIDFGTIGASLGIPGAVPGGDDGSVKVKVSDWSFAFNGGVLFEPTPTTRIGVSYFYNNAAHLTGSAQFEAGAVGSLIAAASGAFVNTAAAGALDYPDHANLGIVQQITPDLDLRAGLTWTQWSAFRQELITFANPAQASALTIENWRDTYTVAVGGTYQPAPNWVVRAGIAWDQSPVPGTTNRTPRLPDGDRITPSIGAGYQLTARTRIDVAYQHIFGGTNPLDVISATGDTLVGKTELSADIVAVQLAVTF